MTPLANKGALYTKVQCAVIYNNVKRPNYKCSWYCFIWQPWNIDQNQSFRSITFQVHCESNVALNEHGQRWSHQKCHWMLDVTNDGAMFALLDGVWLHLSSSRMDAAAMCVCVCRLDVLAPWWEHGDWSPRPAPAAAIYIAHITSHFTSHTRTSALWATPIGQVTGTSAGRKKSHPLKWFNISQFCPTYFPYEVLSKRSQFSR